MKSKVLMTAVAILIFATLTTLAQRPHRPRQQPKSPEERAQMITKHLSKRLMLSPQQSQQLGLINKDALLEMNTIRKEIETKKDKNEAFDRKAYRERIRAINERREQQTIALLDEKQKAEYIKMKTEMDEKRKKRQEMRRKHHKKDTGMWFDEDTFDLEEGA
ncbi:MAG: hypothetical protein OHK0045_22480 [Raineya sp.]